MTFIGFSTAFPWCLYAVALPSGVTALRRRSKRDVRRRCRFIDTLSVSDRDCPWQLPAAGRAAETAFWDVLFTLPSTG
jgi:hypothetical protein